MKKEYLISGIVILAIILTVYFYLTMLPEEPRVERNVSWDDAVTILNRGDVEQVFQTHDLQVILTLEDGTTLHTTEPEIDLIFEEVQKCGEACEDIVLATE
mgnify:CR=1 FL=1